MELSQIGKLVIIVGVSLVAFGALILLLGRIPFFGQLPGDINYRRGNTTLYVPLVSMLIISILLTIALNLILRR